MTEVTTYMQPLSYCWIIKQDIEMVVCDDAIFENQTIWIKLLITSMTYIHIYLFISTD